MKVRGPRNPVVVAHINRHQNAGAHTDLKKEANRMACRNFDYFDDDELPEEDIFEEIRRVDYQLASQHWMQGWAWAMFGHDHSSPFDSADMGIDALFTFGDLTMI